MATSAGNATPEGQLNLKQAASRLGVHYMTAYRYVRQGRLEASRVGTEWQIPVAAIDDFLAGRAGREPAEDKRGSADERSSADERGSVDWAGRMTQALLAGDEPTARRVIDAALAAGRPPEYCYNEMLAGALARIGNGWAAGELTVADQHIATAVATRVVAYLGIRARRPGRSRGTVVFGAPTGERHSLPVAIAADLVRLAGFEVLELGADVPPEAFALAAQRAERLVAVGIGVTTTDHLPAAQSAIDAVRQTELDVAILIGGQAAITTAGAALSGATAWAVDGPQAVELIVSLCRHGHS